MDFCGGSTAVCGTVTGPGNPSPFHQTLLARIQASTLAPRQRLDKWPPRRAWDGGGRAGRSARCRPRASALPSGERGGHSLAAWTGRGPGDAGGTWPRLCGPWAQAGGEPGELCLSSESPGDSHGQVPPPPPTEATEGCDGTKGPLQSPYSPSPPVVKGGQWGGWQGALTSPWREGGV